MFPWCTRRLAYSFSWYPCAFCLPRWGEPINTCLTKSKSQRNSLPSAFCSLIRYPDIGFFIEATVLSAVDGDWCKRIGNGIDAAFGEAHVRPLLPLRHCTRYHH